jgi:hypothetical protein
MQSMESVEYSPWNEHGIHVELVEIFDKVPFHMEFMWTVLYHSI